MGERTAPIKSILGQPARLAAIRREVGSSAEHAGSRKRLAEVLCCRFGFRDPQGKPQVASCLKALRGLEAEGHFRLPARQLDIVADWRQRRLPAAVPEPRDVPQQIGAIRCLRLVVVDPEDDEAMRIWNELVIREHPFGERRLVGRQMRYLVGSQHGWLGAIGFSASALTLEARDRWIGWTAEQRHRHEHRVIGMSRFLIRPSVRCQNLASHVLGACLRRVERDYGKRYGYRPWLVETFVEREQHKGTCFQAANWERVGETKGRGRNDREWRCQESVKDVYVYPLVADFRERIGVPPEAGYYLRPVAVEEGLGAGEWARQEFGAVELGDERLRARLIKIAEDRWKQPGASYLKAVDGDRHALKAYYYFIDHRSEVLSPEAMLATHRRRTIERAMAQEYVLVVQDTTDLNFATRHHTSGLGLIGTNQTGAESQGLKLHTSLALTEEGLPLGVLRSVCYAEQRKGEQGKVSVGRPIEEKKSFRWIEGYRDCVAVAKRAPKTRFLTVADREGDLLELFFEAEPTRRRVGVLVRAKHNRRLEGEEQKLFEELKSSQNTAEVEVVVPRQRWKEAKRGQPEQQGLAARQAVLTVSWQEVAVRSTRSDLRSREPITLWGVYAREENAPPEAKPIEWMLLTTEQVRTAEQAARMVKLYTKRWRIEEWHHVLKSGLKVKEHQHETAERLKRAIQIDVVLAWRLQLLTLLGREVPDLPCTVFFDEWEVKLLEAIETKKGNSGWKPPFNLGQAIILVAKQGGYLARNSDPPPGPKVLWRGIVQVSTMACGYKLAFPRDGP